MADATYTPSVYRKQDGDELIIASGGTLDVESGGSFKLAGTAITATAAELNQFDASATTGVVFGVASGTLSASEINDLKDTQITAIAAPGAGRAVVPLWIHIFHDHGGTDFVQDAAGDHLALAYSGGVEIDEIGSEAQCTALVEASADTQLFWSIGGVGWIPTANEAVVFDNNGSTDYTTGDGVFDYYISYAIVPVA